MGILELRRRHAGARRAAHPERPDRRLLGGTRPRPRRSQRRRQVDAGRRHHGPARLPAPERRDPAGRRAHPGPARGRARPPRHHARVAGAGAVRGAPGGQVHPGRSQGPEPRDRWSVCSAASASTRTSTQRAPWTRRSPAASASGSSYASILAMQPRVVLMDEPDSGIDVEALTRIFDALADFKEQGATVIMIAAQPGSAEARRARLPALRRAHHRQGRRGPHRRLLRRQLHELWPHQRPHPQRDGGGRRVELTDARAGRDRARAARQPRRPRRARQGRRHRPPRGPRQRGGRRAPRPRAAGRRRRARRRHRGLDPPGQGRAHRQAGAHVLRHAAHEGLQRIVMHVEAEEDSFASVQAHCTFPNAVDITHKMDADVVIGPGRHLPVLRAAPARRRGRRGRRAEDQGARQGGRPVQDRVRAHQGHGRRASTSTTRSTAMRSARST